MSRIFIFFITLLALSQGTAAQTTYTWVGADVGDYQQSTNWSPLRTAPATTDILAFNAIAPITVANVPNQTIGAVRILSGTSSVTFRTNVVTNILSLNAATPLIYTTAGSIISGDLLTIALTNTVAFTLSSGTFGIAPSSGGKVTINSDVILSGGTLDFDVVGTGGTTINSGGSITYSTGTFVSTAVSAITWASGATYFHAADGSAASAIPVSFWAGGSTCIISGMNAGTVAPTGFTSSTFANFTWNTPSQSGNVDIDLAGLPLTVNGALVITSTGSNRLRFGGTGVSTIAAGTYTQTGGTVSLQTSSGSTTLTVRGAFSQASGATIDFVATGGSGTATLNLQGSVVKSPGSTWQSQSANTASVMTVQFSGVSSQVVSIGGGWAITAGRCNIVNNNSDPVGVSITGTMRVINANSTAPASCTNNGNFSGTGTFVYAGSGLGVNNFTLIYSGSGFQTASAVEFPVASGPYNLTISSSISISFPTSFDRTVPGTLTMISGGISIGNNTLSLTNASLATQLVYTAGFITSGTLSRRYPTTGLPINSLTSNSRFPFGTGSNDRSVHIFFSTASLTGGSGGDIAISHSAVINATALTPFTDNGSLLDKRTNSNWAINTGAFNLGSGGTTISITALATNIGSVDNISSLRLTDATAGFGTLIATSGTNDAPLVGKSGLVLADINAKTFYVGSDNVNALQIVTFTWTGAVNTAWTTPGNWTGGVGYPASPTEIAIVNTVGGNMPVIGTGTAISVYQLTVGPSASLTMTGTGSISVFDLVDITGTVSFASTSTFNYASSVGAQTILNLPYGNLAVSGAAAKTLPAATTVTGDFSVSGATPSFGTGTFIYAAGTAPIQRVAATSYYNLSFTGDRGGRQIRLGNGVSNNTINVANVFSMTASNYTANIDAYNTFNFSAAGSQTIPGFTYGGITNTGNGPRIWDPLGSGDPAHVINCKAFSWSLPLANNTTAGSKIRLNPMGATSVSLFGAQFHDFEITGDLNNVNVGIAAGQTLSFTGAFSVTATNFKYLPSTHTFNFNSTGAQTIPAFRTNTATNTPAWKFSNLTVTNGNRVITLGGGGVDTIFISGAFTVPSVASFAAATGFSVAGSTVNFNTGSGNIPVLKPVTTGGNNYNNIVLNGGVRIFAGDMLLGGDVSVIGSDAAPATLNVGTPSNNRTITILGNLSVSGTSSMAALTSTIDFNAGTTTSLINLAGNLSVSGTSQLTTTNGSVVSGNILFNGTAQQYSNTAVFKNGFVNFIVGNGTAATTLTLNDRLELIRSGVAPYSSSFTIAANSFLNAGTKNISIGTDDGNVGNNAAFNLNSGATLITANTGIAPHTAIEGSATSGTDGTILAGTGISKNYHTGANYVLNGATVNPFPAAISTMANLTIGAPVSLNKAIVATGTLDLASFTLTQAANNLQFSGLTSTTGNIYADRNASLSITGSTGTVGALRFATGGNTTGEFTINRPVTVQLNSDLIIDKTPLTGNFVTGSASSILDINGNTLTINGSVSGTGSLSGSTTSSLNLGGAAGTVSFTSGKQVLKNLSLAGNATATLGTPLDITGGTTPGNEGTVSVTGTSVLTTGGNLTLKSGATGTARVAPGAVSGGYISGDVTVERYLSSIRSWRFLAAPTFGQTIKQSWQENQPAGVNPGTGYGTNITTNAGAWAANGFDFYSNSSSLLVYNAALNGWQGVPNTFVQISAAGANKAYMLFLRGDRSVTPAVGAPSTAALLRTKGTLFQGDLPPVAVASGQFAAIGNNYAAAIDFTSLNKTNIDQSFSVWDPKAPSALNLGAWVSFSASTPTPWVPVPGGGSYPAGVPNTRIESGQAFMVHNSGGGGSIILNENSKLSGSNLVSRPSGNNVFKRAITTNLYNLGTGSPLIADGNVVVFCEDYANSVDGDDAVKPNNFGDNFGILQQAQTLVVDARQPVAEEDTVFFNMKKIRLQSYRLEFIPYNFDPTITAFLEDKYLNSSTALDMMGTTTVDFSVTSDAASAAANRFRIVFKSTRPLPVTFTNVSVVKKSNGNEVEWRVDQEINVSSYEVERSTDGIHFTKAGAVVAGSAAAYNWLDAYPVNGDNFYRIKSIGTNGNHQYSRIVKVSSVKGKTGFTVYPNPSTDGNIGLMMSNLPAGIYTVKLTNSNGQLMCRELINHPGGTATNVVRPSSKLGEGNYQLEVIDITGKSTVIKVLML